MPTISVVGHEIDVTICDLVADHRAPTPSAAAEAAVRTTDEQAADLRAHWRQLAEALAETIESAHGHLHRLAADLGSASRLAVEKRQSLLRDAAGRLHALSPLATLARGYAIAQSAEGATLASIDAFELGNEFTLRLHDGSVRSTALSKHSGP